VAARLRGQLQARYRRDGAIALLDADGPNGFRAFPAPVSPQLYPSDPEVRRTQRHWQYAAWFRYLTQDWVAPPPPPGGPDAAISGDLPLRSDRSRYTWAALPPLPPAHSLRSGAEPATGEPSVRG
jgi:hypothetical protein